MRPKHQLLLAAFCIAALFASAQKKELPLLLKNGSIRTPHNISAAHIDSFNSRTARFKAKAFAVLQFEQIPTVEQRKELSKNGIELLDYIPQNAYTVSITGPLNTNVLQKVGARSLLQLSPRQKIHASLASGSLPPFAVKVPGTVDVLVTFSKVLVASEVVLYLKEKNIEVLSTDLQAYRVLTLRVAANRLLELAAFPFIDYVQPVPTPDKPLNMNSRSTSGAAAINASVANGGRGLNGEGMVIGIGDDADVQQHIDFKGRLINRAAAAHNAHGVHVSGITAGGGIISEKQRGYAPKATIVSQAFSGILRNASQYVQDYGMVVTNNSYGNIVGCDYNGLYDLNAFVLDQQAFELPYLQHVFAAGNSGDASCAPYPPGFGTVLGGYQTAKNVISVGNTYADGSLYYNSSRGPVRDGRTKPEIATMGTSLLSSYPTNTYAYLNGTSMAAPAVSGGLALLYQRYRQLHNATAKSGLMKALLCNGATDKGPAGPDYSYGFGWMNLLRSMEMLEGNRFIIAQSTQGSTQTYAINVPAGTAQLKVMLYWHDPAASLLSSQALVNDLDLEISNGGTVTLPKILDATPGNVTIAATNGADHINNMEQVVINNPAAGNYTFTVKGTAITQNPAQEYFVVYDIIPVATQLTYPAGGEALVPGEQVAITWDAFGDPANTFTLQYSTDNGANWINIASAVAADLRRYTWAVPAVVTTQAKVRILRNGTTQESTSSSFIIIGTPTVTLSATQCEGYIAINWNSVASATDYEVMLLQGNEMKPVATTTATTYTLNGLSKDSTYWVSVRARVNSQSGRRATALSRQPNTGTCSGIISDNDLKVQALIAPVTGRKYTESALNNATVVQVAIKNLDDAPVAAYTVQYKINGGSWITESGTGPIAAGAINTHAFATPVDLSTAGDYTFTVVVKNSATDATTANDTLVHTVKHFGNAPINLTTDFMDDMEAAPVADYISNVTGLSGLDRYDFEHSTPYGRLRTFVNSGVAASGSKALTLDTDRYYSSGNYNFLTGTYNLSSYNNAVTDIRLDFQYNNHGQTSNGANKVWIRGSDQDGWIEAFDLVRYQNNAGTYKKTYSIELSDLLSNSGQVFTPSFQISWGQAGVIQATDREGANGYTFDDIHLYEAVNDLQLLAIDTPVTVSCALSANTPIGVIIRNSANTTLTNIPIKYRINDGSWVSSTIPSIPGNAMGLYTFPVGADLSAIGTYLIEAVVYYPSDNYRDNDTVRTTIINNPLITTYPYLQNFEADNGAWYTGGKNSSWQYGMPASAKIKSAASGAYAWKTRLTGNHNDNEYSYLYSPCFDISTLAQPALSFSVALDLEDCGTVLCDAAWIEYSVDGKTWSPLTTGITNWYNKPNGVWSVQDYTRWHVATSQLPVGVNTLRLRFVFKSDPAVNREGIALDDIHIYDNAKGIYDGVTMAAPITQTVSGNNWIHFEQDGKLVASVQPNGQDLGSTAAQAYIYTGAVRFTNNQYYHNRNITIKPFATTAVTDSTTVRFYFLDSEAEALVNATGCNTCSKPASAYELGISKYSTTEAAKENGTIGDNSGGIWKFITPADVSIVPFDKGYYAEFKVADFSEFWLNNGSFDQLTPLPVKLLDFTAKKEANDAVVLNWITGSEADIKSYEIELARGNDGLQNNQFVTIGSLASKGTSSAQQQYTFTDNEHFKSGARYYRLKIIDIDGSIHYSPVRSVVFNDTVTWQVFPNPSNAVFQLVYQANAGDAVSAQVTDAAGRIVKEYRVQASGFAQKLIVDLSGQVAGVYLLQVTSNNQTKAYKLYKQ